jgi:hypothetical protein
MANKFSDPSRYSFEVITPSDATDLTDLDYRGIYVGVTGDVALEALDNDTAITFKNVQAGSFLPVGFSKVNATGTTATDILGLL